MYLKALAGYYAPSYFYIYLNSSESVDEAINNNTATFVHEYVHFLQDLILPYCLKLNLLELRKFFVILDDVHQKGALDRPLFLKDEDSEITDKQTAFTWGSGSPISRTAGIRGIKSECFDGQGENGPFTVYRYIATTLEGKQYQIGARDFLEYIAHKIDRRVSNSSNPDFPYRTLDFIFNGMRLSHVDTQTRVCLAEYCLHNDNPMNRLFAVVQEINSVNPALLSSYADCRKFLLTHSWRSRGVKHETIEEKISRRLGQLQDFLQARFDPQNFSDVFQWVEDAFAYVRLNLANRLYFSELYGLSDPEFFAEFSKTVQAIGIPLVFNNKNEVSSVLPEKYVNNDQFLHFFLAGQFAEFVDTEDSECPLLEYCEANDASIIDDKCRSTPQLRATDQQLCPFGVFTKAHGLHTVNWSTKKQTQS